MPDHHGRPLLVCATMKPIQGAMPDRHKEDAGVSQLPRQCRPVGGEKQQGVAGELDEHHGPHGVTRQCTAAWSFTAGRARLLALPARAV